MNPAPHPTAGASLPVAIRPLPAPAGVAVAPTVLTTLSTASNPAALRPVKKQCASKKIPAL